MTPGETALTRTPCGASSLASAFGERGQRRLRRGVHAGAWTAAVVPGYRHDVDDGATPSLDHRGGHGLRGEHGAGKVQRHNLVEALLGDFENPKPRDERSGVVDEDVDRPELAGNAIDERVDIFTAAHISPHRECRTSRCANPIARVFGALPVSVVAEGDACPEGRQRLRRRRANTRRRAGDEGDSAREIEKGFHVGGIVT